MDKILILDFGSQVAQLIARRVREAHVYCELHPYDMPIDAIRAFRNARPAHGLQRELMNTVITTFGQDFGTAMTEFRRVGGHKLGRQSQTWCRIDGRWVIVAAPVSLMDEPAVP